MMFMKIIAILFLSLCISLNSFSQKTWGPTYNKSIKYGYNSIVAETNNGFYTICSRIPDIVLEKYDKNMNQVFSSPINLPDLYGNSHEFINLELINNQLILFTSINNNKSKTVSYYAHLIDLTGKVGKKPTKIESFSFSDGKFQSAHIIISDDKSKFLVCHYKPFTKYKNEKIYFKTFDNQLNMLWEDDITLTETNHFFRIDDFKIDNNGNVFFKQLETPNSQFGTNLKDKIDQVHQFTLIKYDAKKKSPLAGASLA